METRTCTGICFPAGPIDLEGYGNNGKGPVLRGIPWRKCMTDAQRPSQAALETMKARPLSGRSWRNRFDAGTSRKGRARSSILFPDLLDEVYIA